MTKLELMRIKSQLAAVTAAKAEQEYQIEQRRDEIKRLEVSLEAQEKKIAELEEQINNAKE